LVCAVIVELLSWPGRESYSRLVTEFKYCNQ
jgi:hypothetical protein